VTVVREDGPFTDCGLKVRNSHSNLQQSAGDRWTAAIRVRMFHQSGWPPSHEQFGWSGK